MSGTQGAMHILTVHFNTPELTSRLVAEIPKRTPKGRTIHVRILDNCSTPTNLRTLRARIDGLRGVTLETSETNLGFGEGMNVLARRDDIEGSDILWLLNPDTRLTPDCLELVESHLDSGEFAVISPLIFSDEGSGGAWIWYCGGRISEPDLRVQHDLYGSDLAVAPALPFETEFVTGAAPLMLASTFRAIGGFPPGYFLYWEDTHLSWEAREMGLRLGVVPSAHLWHAVGASSGSGQSATFYYWSTRNRFVFAKHLGIPRFRLLAGRGGVESLRPVVKAMRERENRLTKTWAAVRGTFDGLRWRQG